MPQALIAKAGHIVLQACLLLWCQLKAVGSFAHAAQVQLTDQVREALVH